MRTWWAGSVAAVAAVALCAYFGYRMAALERRVDSLTERLGQRPSEGTAGAGAGSGYEQRLAALERDQLTLHDDLRTLEAATADPTQPRTGADQPAGAQPVVEQRILSVIGKEQSRIRDRQLEFHRQRWLEQREAALDQFAETQKLSSRQRDTLHQLLADELDGIVTILKRPDAGENPERVADDWRATLEATDYAAHKLLDPAQTNAWDVARFIERRILWPWLPEP
jgi:hypothetical protein